MYKTYAIGILICTLSSSFAFAGSETCDGLISFLVTDAKDLAIAERDSQIMGKDISSDLKKTQAEQTVQNLTRRIELDKEAVKGVCRLGI